MPGDAVSRTANVERNGGHKWVKRVFSRAEHQIPACTINRYLSPTAFVADAYQSFGHL